MSQQNLSALVDSESSRRLMEETVEVKERARLRCVEREGAGDWLGALPSKALGLHLRRSEFVAAGRYRLGLPVFSMPTKFLLVRTALFWMCHRSKQPPK